MGGASTGMRVHFCFAGNTRHTGSMKCYLRDRRPVPGSTQTARIGPMKSLRFDVFGRQILITKSGNEWAAYCLGAEGKR
jgi:hypothetical protein